MIRVFDPTLALTGEIDNYKSCIINRKFRGVETLDLTMPYSAGAYSLLAKYSFLWAADNKVFEILHRQVSGENTDEIKVVAYGVGKLLSRRLTLPPSGQEYDAVTGSRDAIVKAYIAHNLTAPTDTARDVAILTLAATQSGASVTDRTRLQNLYDEVARVLAVDDRGFKAILSGGSLIFDTYTGVDRSSASATPIIFSRDFDNIKSRTYIESLLDAKSVIYAGGSGEGTSRTIRKVGTAMGAERFEFFVDASNAASNAEIDDRATAELSDGTRSLEAIVTPSGSFEYEIDYDLGDIVTVIDKRLGLTLDTRITEVAETYQAGSPRQISFVFGSKMPTDITTMHTQRRQINRLAAK